MKTARRIACEVLTRCEAGGQYSNLALDAALKREKPSEADRALATVLVYGVLEKRLLLDHVIGQLSSRPIEEISPEVRQILRIGLYQLAFLDRIPDHAAVSEAVNEAGKRAGGFVNAVLRRFLRNGKKYSLPDETKEPLRHLSVKYSVCEALCARLIEDFGMERTRSILLALEQAPPLTLRTNTLKISRDELLLALRQAGYDAVSTENSKSGICIRAGAAPTALPGFADGWFFVQDEASQLCVEALDAHAGMRILDTCACPGSKSFGLAMEMQDCGELIACDLHASKLSLVASGAERLGIHILSTVCRDARAEAPQWLHGAAPLESAGFDRILCDVPCSGFGVLAKKPELRYKNPAESEALPQIQLEILASSARFLRPGGRLVYSTCTVLPQENSQNVARFLAAAPDFSLLWERALFPDSDKTDGFYIAVLQKKERQKGQP